MPAQPLSDVYAALQAADAAGDTAGAQQLADYIRSQPAAPISAGAAPPISQAPYSPIALPDPNSTYPVGSEIGAMLQNAWPAFGRTWPNLFHGAQQIYAQGKDYLTGSDTYPQLQAEEAERRHIDAPLTSDLGGKLGTAAGYAPFAMIPGANTLGGAAVVGGLLGAAQPTVEGESRGWNTGIGAGTGLMGSYVGNKLGNWITERAEQPFLGWNQGTANRAAAQAVGSAAPALTQDAIRETSDRLGAVFDAARSPQVVVPVGTPTASVLTQTANGLDRSSRIAFSGNSQIQNLANYLRAANRSATAQQLGAVSSRLGQQATTEMTSKAGDRELGRALFDVKEHVDDLIGNSIQDASLQAAYTAARPQYRTLMTLTNRPTILNSATGDVNMRNLGNYLQRYDKPGYLRGGNDSPLYQAARFGQATGLGSRPPPPILQPLKWAGYHAVNNPVVGAMGGAISRFASPIAPVIPRGLLGAMYGTIPPQGGLLANPQ